MLDRDRETDSGQYTNVCPSNCKESEGFGTCDEATATCTCTLGWTGPGCTEATCCPIWVVIIAGLFTVFTAGGLLLFHFRRVKPERPSDDEMLAAKYKYSKNGFGRSMSLSQIRASERMAAKKSGKPLTRSHTSASLVEPTPSETPASKGPLRRSATAPLSASPGKSSGKGEGTMRTEGVPLRSSAWPESSPGTSPSGSGAASPSEPQSPPSPGKSFSTWANSTKSDGGTASSQAKGDPGSPDMGKSQTDADGTRSIPSLPHSVETPKSEHVEAVEKKMRDMMDHPLLVRKKTMKELLFEHHPDKNDAEHAKEVFQAVNNAKGWFLHDKDATLKEEP